MKTEEFNDIIQRLESNDATLTELNLLSKKLTSVQTTQLCNTLKTNTNTNTSVTTIDLSSNQIDDAGAVAIAEALKGNKRVTTINLGSNQIRAIGAFAIADMLKGNTSVTTIHLGSNQIGAFSAVGTVAIAEALKDNTSVTTIDLSSNQIDKAGAVAIAGMLKVNKRVTTINLSSNQIDKAGAVAIAEALKVNKRVTTINLSSNQIGDASAVDIADMLKVNTSVITIDLSSNQIRDAGVVAIADMLKVNTSMTTIDLSSNQIDKAGAVAIAEALKVNKSVTTIDLSSNQIRDAGAVDIAEALKNNTSMTKINLNDNNISENNLKIITNQLFVNIKNQKNSWAYCRVEAFLLLLTKQKEISHISLLSLEMISMITDIIAKQAILEFKEKIYKDILEKAEESETVNVVLQNETQTQIEDANDRNNDEQFYADNPVDESNSTTGPALSSCTQQASNILTEFNALISEHKSGVFAWLNKNSSISNLKTQLVDLVIANSTDPDLRKMVKRGERLSPLIDFHRYESGEHRDTATRQLIDDIITETSSTSSCSKPICNPY